ncbi:chalcone synthase-like [Herrania umbratica]|uniref:Chalcone synthase-like n=1 Tax=Herrania umbratica TaxID=108875 RepID=A0A6J1A4D6_9ROSI|nr:chalcone synthase-like [Herrania umbratica]
MAFPENLGRRKPAQRLATILSIGKATPAHCISQTDYLDYYFRVTKNKHMTQLKEKFKHICEKSMISKRHFVLTEEIINKNPNISTYSSPSIDIRQQILAAEVPKLAMEAASKAIQEWRQPKSQITHLIFSAVSGKEMPGADYRLAKLLGLPSVKRVMMYFQGCFAGGTILRIAKDIAENNAGARVLVLSSDITLPTFRAPNEHGIPSLISNAIMGDGAAAMIIGADPNVLKERPLFQIVASTENIIPDSEGAIKGHMHEAGLSIHLSRDVPKLIANNIDKCLAEALSPISINDWNSFFWIVHPLGNAVLDQIEIKLGLKKEKLIETRHVLREFGNVSSATVFFILDEMRRRSMEVGKATTGEGLQWGILFGLGASITVETVVLRSFPTNTQLIQGKE